MRTIKIKEEKGELLIFVGSVDQDGKYSVLRLTKAEAGVLSVLLPKAL